jgi:hypothetical protein
MARVPVESGVRAEALQVIAMPKAQAVQERYDPNASQAFQLATALGAAQPIADRVKERALDNEQQAAQRFANSMTPDELRKKIDSGEMPMWKSPLWAAVVQHTAGDNTVKSVFRDVDSQIAQGKFQTQEEMDAYIKQKRDDALAGKSDYERTGFDKNFNQYRERSANQQNAVTTKRLENEAVTVANEKLSNTVAEITGPQFEGKTPQEKVAAVLKEYEVQRTARTLTDDNARSALDAVILKLAGSGNVELVNEFLKTKLPNNGPSIESFIDVRNGQSTGRSLKLRNTAETQFNQNQREAEKRVVAAQQDVILRDAQAQADELVALRNGASMPDVTVPTADGGTRVVKGSDLVEASVQRQVAANPNMDYAEQVRLYKNNGVVNQQWKKEFSATVYNLGEITIDAEGKPSGTLLKGTSEQLERFSVARQVSEQYAKDLVGEDNYKILNKVQALREAGIPELAQAAGIVNQINRRQYEPQTWGKIQKDVSSEIENIKNPSMFSGRFWSELFRGEFGTGDKNIIPIEGNIRELAEAFVQGRVAPDSKTAVKMASDYMSKSVVQINNTLYMRSDLPKAPQGEDEVKMFERYQKEVLLPRLKKMGIDPSIGDLTLLPQKGGQAMFTVTNRGMPLPREDGIGILSVTNREIEEWTKGQMNIRNTEETEKADKILKRKQRPIPPTRIIETPEGAALTPPRGVSKRNE